MRKKILILANLDIGLYKFRKELIQELQKEGGEVYLSLPYGEGNYVERFKEKGCQFFNTCVDRRGMNPVKDGKLFLRYWNMMRKVRPDQVITYTIKPNIYGGMAAWLTGTPYVVNITGLGTAFLQDGMMRKIVTLMYRLACRKASVVFFENEENRQTFLKYKIVKEEQTFRLNGAGVNLEDYRFTAYPEEKEKTRFLFIGRVMKEKGVDELFSAFEKLKSIYPQAELDVVGPYEDNYRELVEKLEKKGVIRYCGYQEDVRPFIGNSHCFVLPSYHEGMANTLLEAGAMGRPLIASDVAGCREAIEDGKNGFLIKPKHAEHLRGMLEKFLLMPYQEKQKMGEFSRKKVAKEFDKRFVVEETMMRLR
jgi:glycosyltransferase involved in cell wall biosynthesis